MTAGSIPARRPRDGDQFRRSDLVGLYVQGNIDDDLLRALEGSGVGFKRGFKTSALADSFRAQLVTAARSGEAFTTAMGLPVSMSREEHTATWYEFACAYVDMKWPDMSGKSRMGIAETLATITPALVAEAGRPRTDLMRRALFTSVPQHSRIRERGTPPRARARARARSDGWRATRVRSPTSHAPR